MMRESKGLTGSRYAGRGPKAVFFVSVRNAEALAGGRLADSASGPSPFAHACKLFEVAPSYLALQQPQGLDVWCYQWQETGHQEVDLKSVNQVVSSRGQQVSAGPRQSFEGEVPNTKVVPSQCSHQQGLALSFFSPRRRSDGSESSVLAFGFAHALLSGLSYIDNYHVTKGSLLCPGTFDLSRSAAPVQGTQSGTAMSPLLLNKKRCHSF
ncbi:hypothetical protein Baya_11431 [Bagarius yarrelli]|uniref:Uncharacterized protein n=1 Tax=Bagarius yarrelli TaxID=175774 RepID=A0A556V0Q2_BAGYA|nr:hypothetical protein Baya_11431 [Bagarius yarrelli]